MGSPESRSIVSVDTFLESTLESVNETESLVLSVAQEMGFNEEDSFRLGMAVREAVVNAVVHGNRYSANKKVHFVIVRSSTEIEILVRDQGSGFVPEEQPDPLAEENLLRQSGRGVMLMRAFTDEFIIRPGPTGGTEVMLRKAIPKA
jgi:serine/threonine-protein kinase RsbW